MFKNISKKCLKLFQKISKIFQKISKIFQTMSRIFQKNLKIFLNFQKKIQTKFQKNPPKKCKKYISKKRRRRF